MEPLLLAVVIVLTINWIHYMICLSRKSRFEGHWLLPGTWIGFVGLTVHIILKATEMNQVPVETQQGIFLLFGWSIIAVFLVLLASFPLKSMGSLVLPTALLFVGLPLVPADFFSWGSWVHILFILMAYGTFTVSFLLAIGYLRAEHQLRAKSVDHYFFMFPSLETLDRGLRRTIWIGLISLVIGITLGVVDGIVSGTIGINWFLDTNVMGAIITALIYGTIAYIRKRSLFTNHRIAYLTIAGFTFIVILFLGMNYYSKMHPFL